MNWRWHGHYVIVAMLLPSCINTGNVALNKNATQLGVWGGFGPELAVDGDIRQRLYDGSCAYPDKSDNRLTAAQKDQRVHWSVDLASNNHSERFVVVNVTIYFRNCCDYLIMGTIIHIGEEAGWQQQTECGQITSSEFIQTVTCSSDKPVRYLTVWHPTNKVMMLCEVIVNGYRYTNCPEGWWGQESANCQTPCSGNCFYSCDDITGTCRDCEHGKFGQGCTTSCNCRYASEICSPRDGHCYSGCPDGFSGIGCTTDCQPGKFGRGCTTSCNCRNASELCNSRDGNCSSGCPDGFFGLGCTTALPKMKVRPSAVTTSFTSVVLEFPPSEPPAAYYVVEYRTQSSSYMGGTRAEQTAPGRFQATQTGLSADTLYIFRIVPYTTGDERGIPSDPLYHSTLDCEPGKFGRACTASCNCRNALEICNTRDGNCNSGCPDGFSGTGCTIDCDPGKFGSGCTNSCNCRNTSEICNPRDGGCSSGCPDRFSGTGCSIALNTRPMPKATSPMPMHSSSNTEAPQINQYLDPTAINAKACKGMTIIISGIVAGFTVLLILAIGITFNITRSYMRISYKISQADVKDPEKDAARNENRHHTNAGPTPSTSENHPKTDHTGVSMIW